MKRPALDTFEQEALAVLEQISQRQIDLRAVAPWTYSGIASFEAAGWSFGVFSDCGEWDYLEWAEAPDGRIWEYGHGWDDATQDESEILQDWNPPDDTLWTDAPVRS